MDTECFSSRSQIRAFIVLACLPFGMALFTRSAPVWLGAALLISIVGWVFSHDYRKILFRFRDLLQEPLAWVSLVFMIFAAASLLWGEHDAVAIFALGELILPLAAALLLHFTLPRHIPKRVIIIAAVVFGLSCLLILADIATGMAIRKLFGLRAATLVFNRPTITLLILYCPLAMHLHKVGELKLAMLLGGLLLAVLVFGDSGAAVLGAAVGAFMFLLSRISKRTALVLLGGGLLLGLVIAPYAGDIAARNIPKTMLSRLKGAHAKERIQIWQSFGAVVQKRPILGTGFGTSTELASDSVADEVPQKRRRMLSSWHAHNALLQVWIEMGLVGALIAGVFVVLLVRSVGSMEGLDLGLGVAAVSAAAAILMVGHSPWQGWWVAALGASIVWFKREPLLPELDSSVASRRIQS